MKKQSLIHLARVRFSKNLRWVAFDSMNSLAGGTHLSAKEVVQYWTDLYGEPGEVTRCGAMTEAELSDKMSALRGEAKEAKKKPGRNARPGNRKAKTGSKS